MKITSRALLALALVLGLVLTLGGPAGATDYGRPSGKWLFAIVSHEVGHCLGWYEHNIPTASSIMRPSVDPVEVFAGRETYRPTSTDIAKMRESRYYTAPSGEQATYYVQYPFVNDSVPVYSRLGRDGVQTAAQRWEVDTALNMWQTNSEPAHGITIVWDSSLAGQSIGGVARPTFVLTGGYTWEITDCVVHVNTHVVT